MGIVSDNPKQFAKAAGLRYVSDQTPGITRQRRGRGYSYYDSSGELIRDRPTRDRLNALAIPPAWEDVWICPDPNGHLLSTGRDAKGRKQYRYHPDWSKLRSQVKFNRLIPFGDTLPTLRDRVEQHLAVEALSQTKVLALVVKLLDETAIRIGNLAYAKTNNSYGLTTLRDRHVTISGQRLEFEFTGKSGIKHQIALEDPRLARAVKRCKDIPGYELFQYFDADGNRQVVDSGDVNDYLQAITEQDFTAKEFRTWSGTVLAADYLGQLTPPESDKEAQAHIRDAIKAAAKALGNRPATCRKYYIHPIITDTYQRGQLYDLAQQFQPNPASVLQLSEQITLAVLAGEAP